MYVLVAYPTVILSAAFVTSSCVIASFHREVGGNSALLGDYAYSVVGNSLPSLWDNPSVSFSRVKNQAQKSADLITSSC
jgi:hypothetical protein